MNRYETLVPNTDLPDFRDPAVPIDEAFTWDKGLQDIDPNGLYVVQFWSDRGDTPPDVAQALLQHDRTAYKEAAEAFPEDFLLYYCDESPTNISKSMCLWTSQRHARGALELPAHREAVRFMRESGVYRKYIVSGFSLHAENESLFFEPVK
jgi:hypothetical protein